MDEQLLDTEEFEQIPWSSLMAEQPAGVDRRVYLVFGVVGAIVVLFFGSRFLGGAAQPQPQPQPTAQTPTESTAHVTTAAPSVPGPVSGVVVSEADLMAAQPRDVGSEVHWRSVALAEWYVTDFFTTDGSPETQRSLDSVGVPDSSADESSVS
ncbi:MAG: hypothetical protein M3132_03965, partial [Actinomycetia bacterium]|nr:hypothetical protein [Actinomycetes bacterium]